MHIGRRIHVLRKQNGMTLQELASDDFSSAHISKVENGKTSPGEGFLRRIAQHFQLPADYFINHLLRDIEVEHVLSQLQYAAINDMEKADEFIDMIDEAYYTYMSPVVSELSFLLLKSAVLYKREETEKADEIWETCLWPYLEGQNIDALPSQVQKAYFYSSGTKKFEHQEYKQSTEEFERYFELEASINIKASLLYNMALCNFHLADFEAALEKAEQSLLFHQSVDNHEDVCLTYNVIAVIHKQRKDLTRTLEVLTNGEELAAAEGFDLLLSRIYHNKALVLRDMGDQDQAIYYFNVAIRLKKANGNQNVMVTFQPFCRFYIELGQLENARVLFEEAREYVETDEEKHLLLEAFLDYYHLTGQEEIYFNSLKTCITHFRKMNTTEKLESLYHKLGDYYYIRGKYKYAADSYIEEVRCLKA
ncbi:helix-turn-helix domain-containing protein [Thalassobacillus sp. CUG 92003]|uniref:helix-turn-helix domain-containing protein n=1 Tax=Thalassobacillus sp. CUG 92003 TaxID=2736641 RepID=UPI0015E7CADB|nr:helix-turn-helix domain-containing protein [Thalassobacillus sp. CUG 92003]